MGKIVIYRTSEYSNRYRNYEVYVDGKKLGKISNGETREYEVLPGQHSLVAKIDWCSSKSILFDMNAGEVKSFKVGGFRNAKWLMPASVIIIVLSFQVNFEFGFKYLFYSTIPVFLLLVYFLTIGRKRYLTLTEMGSEGQESLVFE